MKLPSALMSRPSGYRGSCQVPFMVSGDWIVDVPLGSHTWYHESEENLPVSMRLATIRPLSACATAFHFSTAPLTVGTGPARRTRWVPSSDASHTSPFAMYATDAA